MRALRFCFVTTFYPPYHFGGDGVFVYRLAEELAARGHQVDVLHNLDAYRVKSSTEPDVSFAHHPNVRRYPLESAMPRLAALSAYELGRPAAYRKQIEAHFAAHDYDVIHFHNASLMGAPAVFRLGSGVKLYTTHEYWLICPTHVLFKYDREACTSRDCVRCTLYHKRPPQLWRQTGLLDACVAELDTLIMPSQFARDRHRRDGIKGSIAVLPHFVPVPSDAQLSGDLPTLPRPYFLYVGRLEKLKGVQDLLTIFADYRDADLLIVGTGAYEGALRSMARTMPHVKFLGAMHPSEISRHYRQATAVLVPSLCYEAFALIAAEAMAHGTPVIGRRIGALQELVETSGGGVTFGTLDECRDAMQTLLADPTLRATLGTTGRRFAQRHWTVDAHLEQYLALVVEQMERRAGNAQP